MSIQDQDPLQSQLDAVMTEPQVGNGLRSDHGETPKLRYKINTDKFASSLPFL